VAAWRRELVTDDLLDGLPPAALTAVRQVAEELTVRESMIFRDGRDFTGEPPGLRTVQRGQLMLVYLTDVRGETRDHHPGELDQLTQAVAETPYQRRWYLCGCVPHTDPASGMAASLAGGTLSPDPLGR
jgi:hypothetical protein